MTNATVRRPDGQVRTLLLQGSIALQWEERFDTQSALDAAYPHTGLLGQVYRMTLETVNDGVQAQNLTYTFLTGGYPTTARVLNWADAQRIDHTLGFTLQWNDLGGNTLDPVQLLVTDEAGEIVYSSPAPFTTGALRA